MKKSLSLLAGASAVFMGLSAGGIAEGATVSAYDNLGPSNSFMLATAAFGSVGGPGAEQALQFTATNTLRLTEIDVAIGVILMGDGPGAALVQLRLDEAGLPGTLVESWVTSPITSVDGSVVGVRSTFGPTVAAGKKYWITLGRAPASNLGGGWFMAGTSTGGYAWTASRYVGDPWSVQFRTRAMGSRISGDSVTAGDANGDGRINADDYALLDRGYAKHLTGWTNGDFSGDNQVTSADYLIIDSVRAQQAGGLDAALLAERQAQFGADYVNQLVASVPEPGTGMVVAGAMILAGRRRRAV